jgi:ferric-dicitrate binding protein FerR (iron transport regulator)
MGNRQIELIIKFLSGELSNAERMELSTWLSEDSGNVILFNKLVTFWNSKPKDQYSKKEVAAAFQKTMRRTDAPVQLKERNFFQRPSFRAAASILVILAITSAIGLGVLRRSNHKSAEVAFITLENKNSGTKKFTLYDGTKVYLDRNSRLVVQNGICHSRRLVRLTGQAFFDVKRNENAPFIVEADKIKVKVLGTKFSVRAYKGNPSIEATLVSGSVAVETQQKGACYFIKPNQQLTYYKSNSEVEIEKVNAKQMTSWKEGYFTFDNMALSNIVKLLKEYHNVDFQFASEEAAKAHFTGRFDAHETIDDVISQMEKTSTVGFRKLQNNTILVFKK